VNCADLMAAQGAFGTDFYDRSIRSIVGTMLWMEYRPVIKIGPKGPKAPWAAMRSAQFTPLQASGIVQNDGIIMRVTWPVGHCLPCIVVFGKVKVLGLHV